jgi:hypothetical protein
MYHYSECLISTQVMKLQEDHALLHTSIDLKLTDKDWIKSCQDSATEHRSTSPSKQEEKYTALISYPTKQSINSAAFSLIAFESFSIFKGLQDECLLSYQQGHNRAPRINVL